MTQKQTATRRPRRLVRMLVAGVVALPLFTEPATAQSDLAALMRQKLDRAQQLFEAVVLGRFSASERHARALLRISEDSTWTQVPTTEFLNHAAEFQEAARDLRHAAEERDMEEVSVAYMALVSTCVQCHRHVRGARRVDGGRRRLGPDDGPIDRRDLAAVLIRGSLPGDAGG